MRIGASPALAAMVAVGAYCLISPFAGFRRRQARAVWSARRFRRRLLVAARSDEMFERFTDRARRVVILAQEEARMLNRNYIDTEHILVGLMHEGEGVAATALERLGISLDGVRQHIEEIVGPSQHGPGGQDRKSV